MSVRVQCSCSSSTAVALAEPPALAADYTFHPLAALYFCEECDSIKCPRCVTEEIACYYCPNCLFEVPTASVRGEKNRCARNCFLCPQCHNTLGVVATDPESAPPPLQPASSVGEAPYYLACSACKWDSKDVGVVFDKPTGLSAQIQKQDDASPLNLSFDHVRDHLEPFLKAGLQAQQAAASRTTLQSVREGTPNLGVIGSTRFGSMASLAARTRSAAAANAVANFRDELPNYDPPFSQNQASSGKQREDRHEVLEQSRQLDDLVAFSDAQLRTWSGSLRKSNLRPTRVPLHAKRTKRCPVCKHILSKPDTKAASIKFRIKLVAAHYLPAIEIYRRSAVVGIGSRISAAGAGASTSSTRGTGRSTRPAETTEDPLRPGRSYGFELTFVNPLYEPIHIRLALVQAPRSEPGGERPFTLSLPAATFPIAAFAEQWEYDDDADELLATAGGSAPRRSRAGSSGVLERKANRTTVLLEASIGKDTVGSIQTAMLVTYVYATEEASATGRQTKADTAAAESGDSVKSFSYWTMLTLGTATPQRVRTAPSTVTMPLAT